MDEKADPTDMPRLPGPSVLVVEDEFLIALELEILLTGNGWNVIGPASSVREALLLLQDARPDAAVLDVKLADGPVTAVAETMRRLGVPFVLSTGLDPSAADMPDIIVRCRVVQKPVEWKRLQQPTSGLLQLSFFVRQRSRTAISTPLLSHWFSMTEQSAKSRNAPWKH